MSDQEPEDQPMIRFAGEWVPAHDVWQKMETVTVVVEHIQRFNERFPHLSSHETRNVVPLVRQRLKEIELRLPSKEDLDDISRIAIRLLNAGSVDDALDTLAAEHDLEIGLEQLVQVAGEKAYMGALQREAKDFAANRITPEQNAQLWNELGRPAPGGGLWSPTKIITLLAGD